MSTSPLSALADAIPFDVLLERLKETESKISARQREILRAVEAENARQAMKRRKLLHNEGSFPEWAR